MISKHARDLKSAVGTLNLAIASALNEGFFVDVSCTEQQLPNGRTAVVADARIRLNPLDGAGPPAAHAERPGPSVDGA